MKKKSKVIGMNYIFSKKKAKGKSKHFKLENILYLNQIYKVKDFFF